MARLRPPIVGVMAAVILGTSGCGGDEASSSTSTSVTVETTVVTSSSTTSPPTTVGSRSSTTRTTSAPRATTTTARPSTTVATTTSTTKALTRAEATQALCRQIESAVRLVAGGNTLGGGLRLAVAIGDYEAAADPTAITPAKRMLSTARAGDLESSAAAALEAQAACGRLGFPITYPQPPQCVTTPCPPF